MFAENIDIFIFLSADFRRKELTIRKFFELCVFGADAWDTKLFFGLFSVEHVVYAERNDFVGWRYVMDDAMVCPFHIESERIHESHASD